MLNYASAFHLPRRFQTCSHDLRILGREETCLFLNNYIVLWDDNAYDEVMSGVCLTVADWIYHLIRSEDLGAPGAKRVSFQSKPHRTLTHSVLPMCQIAG